MTEQLPSLLLGSALTALCWLGDRIAGARRDQRRHDDDVSQRLSRLEGQVAQIAQQVGDIARQVGLRAAGAAR